MLDRCLQTDPGEREVLSCKAYVSQPMPLPQSAGPERLDLGDVLYAPNAFVDVRGRVLMLAWLQELRGGASGGFDYAGCLSLPRVLTLQGRSHSCRQPPPPVLWAAPCLRLSTSGAQAQCALWGGTICGCCRCSNAPVRGRCTGAWLGAPPQSHPWQPLLAARIMIKAQQLLLGAGSSTRAGASARPRQRHPLPAHEAGLGLLRMHTPEHASLTGLRRPAGGRLHQAPAPELAGLRQGAAFHAQHIELDPGRAMPIGRVRGPSVEVRAPPSSHA